MTNTQQSVLAAEGEVHREPALARRSPNFLYIGTSKAGSTWLYNVLTNHPQIFTVAEKGLHFFDDHLEYGMDWYLEHFAKARDESVVAEISHSYLYSSVACERIAEFDPQMRLMVCLRDPVDRAFSSYLDHVKNGKCETTFEEALKTLPIFTERGRYATNLAPYVSRFGREQLHVAAFDDLASNPQQFARDVFRFLDVDDMELRDEVIRKRMPAGKPRYRTLVKLAKRASHLAEKLGLAGLRGRAKRSTLMRSLLYRSYTAKDKPVMLPETRQMLHELFRSEALQLDDMLGTEFCRRWGYDSDA